MWQTLMCLLVDHHYCSAYCTHHYQQVLFAIMHMCNIISTQFTDRWFRIHYHHHRNYLNWNEKNNNAKIINN